MRVKGLKILDATVGRALVCSLPAARPIAITAASGPLLRVLVIRPGGIGDAVLLIPALLALKDALPQAEITVLAERRNAAVFSLCPAVGRVFNYDVPSELTKVFRGGYDMAIDTEQWHRLSAVVARLVSAPISIGFATNDRKKLFLHPVGYSHDDYEVDSFFKLLAPLGVTPPDALLPPFLTVPHAAKMRADELLAPMAGRTVAAFFPGASISERRWGAERFREVAQSLSSHGVAVVVVGGREDAADGERIVAGTGGFSLAGKTSLVETAAVLARCTLLVSGDSGVLHMAVGLGVPTVSLFGPGIQAKWGPRGEGDIVLNRNFSCSPCTRFGTTPRCPDRARCLSEITPREVVAAVERLLSRTKGGPAGII